MAIAHRDIPITLSDIQRKQRYEHWKKRPQPNPLKNDGGNRALYQVDIPDRKNKGDFSRIFLILFIPIILSINAQKRWRSGPDGVSWTGIGWWAFWAVFFSRGSKSATNADNPLQRHWQEINGEYIKIKNALIHTDGNFG